METMNIEDFSQDFEEIIEFNLDELVEMISENYEVEEEITIPVGKEEW